MKWLKRRRLRKELKSYPRSHHDDQVDSLLYAMGWCPDDLRSKRKWWQFWKRRRKVAAVGLGKRARGKNLICTRPDLMIIDDMEADAIKAPPDKLARWYKEYQREVKWQPIDDLEYDYPFLEWLGSWKPFFFGNPISSRKIDPWNND